MTFEYKDYADGNKTKILTLEATEFIRRFLLHILPSGFVRIRQFGFLANRARGNKLKLCRILLGASAPTSTSIIDHAREVEEPNDRLCPACKIGHMILIGIAPMIRLVESSPRQDSS